MARNPVNYSTAPDSLRGLANVKSESEVVRRGIGRVQAACLFSILRLSRRESSEMRCGGNRHAHHKSAGEEVTQDEEPNSATRGRVGATYRSGLVAGADELGEDSQSGGNG